MTTISINENKYGFIITRKNKTNLKFEATDCKCISPIYNDGSTWYIKVQLPKDVAERIISHKKHQDSKGHSPLHLAHMEPQTAVVPARLVSFASSRLTALTNFGSTDRLTD